MDVLDVELLHPQLVSITLNCISESLQFVRWFPESKNFIRWNMREEYDPGGAVSLYFSVFVEAINPVFFFVLFLFFSVDLWRNWNNKRKCICLHYKSKDKCHCKHTLTALCTHTLMHRAHTRQHKATGKLLTQLNSNYYSVCSLATRLLDVIVLSSHVWACLCVFVCTLLWQRSIFGQT